LSVLQLSRRAPLILLAVLVAAALALSPWPAAIRLVVASEAGLVEVLTVLVSLAASATAGVIAWRTIRAGRPWVALWFGLFALGLFFLAGEEASWGQHWLRFGTPDSWAERNLQGETNLHNSSLATERILKTLFSLGVLLTGVVWPLVYRRTGRLHPPFPGAALIWPDPRLGMAALVALILRLLERSWVWLDLEDGGLRPWYVAHKESIELFMTLFVLMYLLHVRESLKAQPLASPALDPIYRT
jgi:hypothetical protein